MNKCHYCGHPLEDLEEVHAAYGHLFCSKECTVGYLEDLNEAVERRAQEEAAYDAKELYDEVAEVVDTASIMPTTRRAYEVTITETLSKTMRVIASSAEIAEAIIKRRYRRCDSDCVLSSDNFAGVDFAVEEVHE